MINLILKVTIMRLDILLKFYISFLKMDVVEIDLH